MRAQHITTAIYRFGFLQNKLPQTILPANFEEVKRVLKIERIWSMKLRSTGIYFGTKCSLERSMQTDCKVRVVYGRQQLFEPRLKRTLACRINAIQFIPLNLLQTFHNYASLFINLASTVSYIMPEGAAGTLNIIAVAIDNH